MASTGSLSSYDRILAHRARVSSFAKLAEQRSAARQEAAQRTLNQAEATRNTMINSVAQAGAGTTKLTEMMIRTRMAAETKTRMDAMSKKYA